MGTRSLIFTVLGVIVAIAVAWLLVNFVFHLIYLVVKVIIVLFVAGLVFFALRGIFSNRSDG